MAIDLKTILADGEALFRNGANPDGAATTAYARSLWAAANAGAARTTLGLGTASVADLIDDDTFATASATNVPSAESVAAYVLANGGGDVSSASSTVAPAGNYWDFVLSSSDPSTASDTKLPTWTKAKNYVDALPTLTTSDTGKVPIATVGSVTTIDVDGLLTTSAAEFPDGSFAIENTGDATKRAVFSAASITTATTRTYTLPDIDGTVLLTAGAQTVTAKKTLQGGAEFDHNLLHGALSVNRAFDAAVTNTSVQIHGNPSAVPAAIFLHNSSTGDPWSTTPAQTTSGSVLFSISGRGHDGTNYATANQVRIRGVADEAVSTTWGAKWILSTTAVGASSATDALWVASDQTLRVRNGVSVNAGSSFTAPTWAVHIQGAASATNGLGLDTSTTGPTVPGSDAGAVISVYRNGGGSEFLLITMNDGGTTRYKSLPLNGTSVTWTAGTALP